MKIMSFLVQSMIEINHPSIKAITVVKIIKFQSGKLESEVALLIKISVVCKILTII